jgi:hypothetical protein
MPTAQGDQRIGVSAIAANGKDLLTWTSDWGTVTTAAVVGAVPSGATGTAMTYSYPGQP